MSAKKILICDDSSTDRAKLEKIVTNAGFTVISASGGAEAVAKAKAEKPDLIFLDIIMPDQDGFGTCRKQEAQ